MIEPQPNALLWWAGVALVDVALDDPTPVARVREVECPECGHGWSVALYPPRSDAQLTDAGARLAEVFTQAEADHESLPEWARPILTRPHDDDR